MIGNADPTNRRWSGRSSDWPGDIPDSAIGGATGGGGNSCVQKPSRFKNDVWTCDFIHDRTAGGGSLKWLTLVDEYTRECLVLHAAGALSGADVRRIVARVVG